MKNTLNYSITYKTPDEEESGGGDDDDGGKVGNGG